MKFKKRNTKVLVLSHLIVFSLIAIFLAESIEVWNENLARSVNLIILSGMMLEVLGFIILINPKFIRIIKVQEVDFTSEGILYIIVGLTMQILIVYFVL